MKIGDPVLHQGRPCYLRGFDPMSVPNQQAVLEDARTGEQLIVPVEEIEPEPPAAPLLCDEFDRVPSDYDRR
jgi:hypothetical protein